MSAPEGSDSVSTVRELIRDVGQGTPVVLVDDENRENEGDIILAATHATPEWINFMSREARGLICVAITPERAARLRLPLMVDCGTDPNGTAFTVSVDSARTGTGISAFDRAETVRALIAPNTGPEDLRRPGHLFPLIARPGGVLVRQGHTEAAVDLARLAGLPPAGVICEILGPDGHMQRLRDLGKFCRRFGFRLGTIDALSRYLRSTSLSAAVGAIGTGTGSERDYP